MVFLNRVELAIVAWTGRRGVVFVRILFIIWKVKGEWGLLGLGMWGCRWRGRLWMVGFR